MSVPISIKCNRHTRPFGAPSPVSERANALHILEKHTSIILLAYRMEYIILPRSVTGVNENGMPRPLSPTALCASLWRADDIRPYDALHILDNGALRGAGLRWRPLPQAEAPTEPTGETAPYDAPHILKKARCASLWWADDIRLYGGRV